MFRLSSPFWISMRSFSKSFLIFSMRLIMPFFFMAHGWSEGETNERSHSQTPFPRRVRKNLRFMREPVWEVPHKLSIHDMARRFHRHPYDNAQDRHYDQEQDATSGTQKPKGVVVCHLKESPVIGLLGGTRYREGLSMRQRRTDKADDSSTNPRQTNENFVLHVGQTRFSFFALRLWRKQG